MVDIHSTNEIPDSSLPTKDWLVAKIPGSFLITKNEIPDSFLPTKDWSGNTEIHRLQLRRESEFLSGATYNTIIAASMGINYIFLLVIYGGRKRDIN